MNKLTVGQPIWYVNLDTFADNGLKESTISSVGRKYFTVKMVGVPKDIGRFFKDTLQHDGGEYAPWYKLYLSPEEYEQEIERTKLRRVVLRVISDPDITLGQFEKIATILSSNIQRFKQKQYE